MTTGTTTRGDFNSQRDILLVGVAAELCTLHASIESSRVRMLELVGLVDADGSWILTGATSTADWLTKLLDIEACTAREHVRIARSLTDLPAIAIALRNGSLSYSKAKALTRVATPENEAELLDLVDRHPAASQPAALALWQQRHDPDAHRRRQIDERSLTVRTDVSGNHVITIVLPPDHAAEFEALVDAEVTANGTPPSATAIASSGGSQSERRTLAQQRADAFVRLAEQVAERLSDPFPAPARGATAVASKRRRPRPEVVLHRYAGSATYLDGTPLPGAAASYLSCDADVRIMTHYPDGSPADVGRRHRLVTPRLERLTLERAGYRCEHPGCTAKRFLQVHHKLDWDFGGRTDLANLQALCGLHHRLLHDTATVGAAGTIHDLAA